MDKVITKSDSETIKLGEKLAKRFRDGETITLTGDLGAGKTTLIKGIAKGLGIKKNITSPTFVLMKLYSTDLPRITADKPHLPAGRQGSRIQRLCHVDAYRIGSGRELVDIGIMEYIDDLKTLTIIEWAEKVKDILPNDAIWIKMGYGKNENERVIIIDN